MNKLAIIFIVFFIWIGESYSQSCSDCIRNTRGRRDVPAGKGQDFTGPTFIDPSCMYYVQFAVYPMCVKDPDRCERIRAPQGLGEVWLIEHPETYVRGQSTMGFI